VRAGAGVCEQVRAGANVMGRRAKVMMVLVVALALALVPSLAFAQGPTATAQSVPLPDELQPAIQSAIGTGGGGAKVVIGTTTLELWWGSPATSSWDAMEEGALVGALRVTGAFREIRGKTVKPGVYTLRYGLQPQNGDPGRRAQSRVPALSSAGDLDAKALGFDGTAALAKQTTGTSHPAALSIDPPTNGCPLTTHHRPRTEGGRVSGEKAKFGLILNGRIEH
jgi:hypothetical protein